MKKSVWIPVVGLVVAASFSVWVILRESPSEVSLAPAPGSTLPQNAAPAQTGLPRSYNAGQPFKDTSVLKPPAGAKVAIFEFDDLECPACAHAMPLVQQAAAQYGVPVVHHDYPWEFHAWSFDAAVIARYLQDNVSAKVAGDFRRDVFAHQSEIASKDDLTKFAGSWFAAHGQAMPFVMDPKGTCRSEVEADKALGDRVGVASTPCIFVVTAQGFTYVDDPGKLGSVVEAAVKG